MTTTVLIAFIFKFIIVILLADFLTGVFHFVLDQYGTEDMFLFGKLVVEINILHHKDPRHMIKRNYWFLTRSGYLMGAGLLAAEYLILGGIGWGGILLVIYGSQANLIHKWAHQTPSENGKFITLLQTARLIQSPRQHWGHHISPYDKNFCILTNWLNPILEKIQFWQGVIYILGRIGIKPVANTGIRKNA